MKKLKVANLSKPQRQSEGREYIVIDGQIQTQRLVGIGKGREWLRWLLDTGEGWLCGW